jgi:SAM-dependent methyltransferase
MRKDFLPMLRCPRCRAEQRFSLTVRSETAREVREGTVTCDACRQAYAITDGIVDLLHDPPDFVRREAAGLDRFAERMRQDGWGREKIRALPNIQDGYWYTQGTSLNQLLHEVPFQPGERLLDVGSNTCWASNKFAERGLEVIALDIATTEMQGLKTAEYFFEQDKVYFERVLGTMFDVPIASGSLDYVFCCEVLHHNDAVTLKRTFRECYRLLRPGGKLLVINETMKFLMDLKRDHAHEVAEFEGYEHTFFFHQYYLAARRAGFRLSVREPRYHPFFARLPISLPPELPLLPSLKLTLGHFGRKSRLVSQLYLAYLNMVRGGVALNLVGVKPTA